MGRLALGIVLSLLPRHWRERVPLFESIPWQRATIVSGILESLSGAPGAGILVLDFGHHMGSQSAGFRSARRPGGFCTGPGDWLFRIGPMAPASADLVHRIFRHRRCGAHVGRNFH